MKEILKKRIKTFLPQVKDYYTINSNGEIFSDNCGLMKQRHTDRGYCIISFNLIDGGKQTFRVHRLVMMAFNPQINSNKNEVNHIDGNKDNNCLSNLEWCTSSENQLHAFSLGLNKGRSGEKCNFSKITEDQAKQIKLLINE